MAVAGWQEDQAILELLARGPSTLREIKGALGLSQWQATKALARLEGSKAIKGSGFGQRRRFERVGGQAVADTGAAGVVSVPEAGWYADPRGRHEHRYFDGNVWTDHVADRGVASTDPLDPVPPVAEVRTPNPWPAQEPQRREQEAGQRARGSVAEHWVVCANGRVAVVGESKYQPELRAAYERHGRHCWATLRREPTNKYDSNAVQVVVDGATVGYLARENAILYRRFVEAHEAEGRAPACLARIAGVLHDNFGIWLFLGEPSIGMLRAQPTGELVEPARLVGLTKEEHHQDAIRRARERWGDWFFPALREVDRNPHQKKDSGPVLAAFVDDEPLGYFTPAMTERYEHEVTDDPECCAQGLIHEGTRAGAALLEVSVLMPEVFDEG